MAEFKVGDKVKIVREIPTDDPNGMGEGKKWDNSWNPLMSNEIGATSTITRIAPHGAQLEDGLRWWWPLAAFVHVRNKKYL